MDLIPGDIIKTPSNPNIIYYYIGIFAGLRYLKVLRRKDGKRINFPNKRYDVSSKTFLTKIGHLTALQKALYGL